MGDLETDFMEDREDDLDLSEVDILFAPHHGRDRGKVPQSMLDDLFPRLIVIGEADSEYLNYYAGYNKISQNSAGDITFECDGGLVHIYVSSPTYSVAFLVNYGMPDTYGYYLGKPEL